MPIAINKKGLLWLSSGIGRSPEIYLRLWVRAFLFTMGKFDAIFLPDEICSMDNNGMTDYGAMKSDANTFLPFLAHPEAIKNAAGNVIPLVRRKWRLGGDYP